MSEKESYKILMKANTIEEVGLPLCRNIRGASPP